MLYKDSAGYNYFQIAEGILILTQKIEESDVRMPIPFSGCPIEYLLQYAGKKLGNNYEDQMNNSVYISSATGYFDVMKFESVAREAEKKGSVLRSIDFRTKTGSLGKMIKKEAEDSCIDIEVDYTVLYDPNLNAKTRVFDFDFPDHFVKKYLNYVDRKTYDNMLLYNTKGRFHYPHDINKHFSESEVVVKIKENIDILCRDL